MFVSKSHISHIWTILHTTTCVFRDQPHIPQFNVGDTKAWGQILYGLEGRGQALDGAGVGVLTFENPVVSIHIYPIVSATFVEPNW